MWNLRLVAESQASLPDTVRLSTGAGRGDRVVHECGGREALAAARVERPTLVLLDVFLPDVSGFEICRTLRDEFGQDLPIIFVSGERMKPADRAVGLLVGGDDYLVKPVDPTSSSPARAGRSTALAASGRPRHDSSLFRSDQARG